jgi:hypothetical protein
LARAQAAALTRDVAAVRINQMETIHQAIFAGLTPNDSKG